ncbi:hypothetical protein VTI74DRAFT_11436 [Chaetomium olivicolor]
MAKGKRSNKNKSWKSRRRGPEQPPNSLPKLIRPSPKCDAVLHLELLEAILLHVDMRTLLTSAQRVSTFGHNLITSSLPLQRHLFFTPNPDTPILPPLPSANSPLTATPLNRPLQTPPVAQPAPGLAPPFCGFARWARRAGTTSCPLRTRGTRARGTSSLRGGAPAGESCSCRSRRRCWSRGLGPRGIGGCGGGGGCGYGGFQNLMVQMRNPMKKGKKIEKEKKKERIGRG